MSPWTPLLTRLASSKLPRAGLQFAPAYSPGDLSLSLKYRFESQWRLLAIDFGINADALCQRAKLSSSIFDSTNVWLNREEFGRFWEALEAETADPMVGLRIGQWLANETFEPCVVAAYCSSDLMHALESIVDYTNVVSPAGLQTEVTPYSVEVQVGEDPDGPINFQAKIAAITALVQLLRRATRDNAIRPLRLALGSQVVDLAPYRSYFGIEPSMEGPTSISIAAADSRRRFLTYKPLFWRFLAPALRAGLQSERDETHSVEVVRQCLVELLPLGRTQISDVATELGIGVRTLQRRLAVEKESFQSILRVTREEMAKQYLQDGELAVDHISTLLGFESANSLYRAFQKWTGMTPDAFREAHRGS